MNNMEQEVHLPYETHGGFLPANWKDTEVKRWFRYCCYRVLFEPDNAQKLANTTKEVCNMMQTLYFQEFDPPGQVYPTYLTQYDGSPPQNVWYNEEDIVKHVKEEWKRQERSTWRENFPLDKVDVSTDTDEDVKRMVARKKR